MWHHDITKKVEMSIMSLGRAKNPKDREYPTQKNATAPKLDGLRSQTTWGQWKAASTQPISI
jgi:subtilisin-like proprotein convertase family protein